VLGKRRFRHSGLQIYSIPELFRTDRFFVAKEVVHPEQKSVIKGGSSDDAPGYIMDYPPGFIKWAYPDAIGTIRSVFCPKGKTLLGVYIPFQCSGLIGDIMTFLCHLAIG